MMGRCGVVLVVLCCLASCAASSVASDSGHTHGELLNLRQVGAANHTAATTTTTTNASTAWEKEEESHGGGGSSMSGMLRLVWEVAKEPWQPGHGARNVLDAVLQLRGEQEEYEWPRLEWSARVVVAAVLAAAGACLSSAGGVGGGGLFVPLANLVLGFDTKTAAALSNVMILGGSLSNMGVNMPQRHPDVPGRPVIDYDAALLLEPDMLLGIGLGVICNVMFPGWVITALLAVTLWYMTVRSLRGALARWGNESRKMQAVAAEQAHCLSLLKPPPAATSSCGSDLLSPLLGSNNSSSLVLLNLNVKIKEEEARSQETSHLPVSHTAVFHGHSLKAADDSISIGDVEKQMATSSSSNKVLKIIGEAADLDCGQHQYPLRKMGILALVWLVFLAVQLLRGGKGKSLLDLQACGLGYWLFTASQLPIALGFTYWAAHNSQHRHSSQQQEENDIATFAQKARHVLPVMAFMAGLLGGMLGLGGGMIINPLLLEIGMPPQVTAATCAFMVFFSSSMSVVQYWLLGRIPVAHAVLFAAICFLFSLVGQVLVKLVVARYGRASIIVFSVSAVIGLSAVAMAGFGGYQSVQAYLRGDYMGFHRPC